jgi:hypothetical protein
MQKSRGKVKFISRQAVSFTFAAVVIAATGGSAAPAGAASFNPQPITQAQFDALTSAPIVRSSSSTGAASVSSTVYAGAGAWKGGYVYTYEISGDDVFAVSFGGIVSSLDLFYINKTNNSKYVTPDRLVRIDRNSTVYFDSLAGLSGSTAIFGFFSFAYPSLNGFDSLSSRLDTQRGVAYTAPVPAALPLFLTAIAGMALAGRCRKNSGV